MNLALLAIPTSVAIYKAGFRWWWNAIAVVLLLASCLSPLLISAPNPATQDLLAYFRGMCAVAVVLAFWLFALRPWPALRK